MLTETLTTNATETDDDNIYCEHCDVALSDGEIDECGYLCSKCYAKTRFVCVDCGEDFDLEERSDKYKNRCVGCQESKEEAELTAKMDALKEEAQDLLDSIFNDADLASLKKVVASLKRLQPA